MELKKLTNDYVNKQSQNKSMKKKIFFMLLLIYENKYPC